MTITANFVSIFIFSKSGNADAYVGEVSTKQNITNSTYAYYYISSKLKSVTIKGGTISSEAFSSCANLISITILIILQLLGLMHSIIAHN
jgi:hypothetical protein